MAEGAGLLNQYTGNCIEGSNPFPSAIILYFKPLFLVIFFIMYISMYVQAFA